MDWSHENWVKLYTRDTVEWLQLGWEAQAVFVLLLRKVDRRGALALGGLQGGEAVSVVLGVPDCVAGRAVSVLADAGVIVLEEGVLAIPNFVAAQRARTSDRLRKQMSRELSQQSHDVTARHSTSQHVTDVPNRVEKSRSEEREERKPAAPANFRSAPVPTEPGAVDPTEAWYVAKPVIDACGSPPSGCRAWGPADAIGIAFCVKSSSAERAIEVGRFVRDSIDNHRAYPRKGEQRPTPRTEWSNLWSFSGQVFARWDQRLAEHDQALEAGTKARENRDAAESVNNERKERAAGDRGAVAEMAADVAASLRRRRPAEPDEKTT
jgi:hypothetical protein